MQVGDGPATENSVRAGGASTAVVAQSVCPKLCGGQLRLVESVRWGRYLRCGRCGYECRDGGRYAHKLVLATEPPAT
jgi:hypothetical protein